MGEQELIIIIITVVGSLITFYWKMKKDIIKQEKEKETPIIELNQNIVRLNDKLSFINEIIDTLKDRVSNHGREIDDIRIQNQSHEERIKSLEQELNK